VIWSNAVTDIDIEMHEKVIDNFLT